MAIEEIASGKLEELKATPKFVKNPQAKQRTEEKHERVDYEVTAEHGKLKFRIYKRQNLTDKEDFSCGIRWLMPSGETLTLARYNGSSHSHGDIEYENHIHVATEEAIAQGQKPERCAKETKRYRTLGGALNCLLIDFKVSGLDSQPDQAELF
jgi:hypothetical protein